MEENLKQVLAKAKTEIVNADSPQGLEDLRIKYLGKKGIITDLKKSIAKLPNEEKPKAGKLINQTSKEIETELAEKNEIIKKELLKEKIKAVTSIFSAFIFSFKS